MALISYSQYRGKYPPCGSTYCAQYNFLIDYNSTYMCRIISSSVSHGSRGVILAMGLTASPLNVEIHERPHSSAPHGSEMHIRGIPYAYPPGLAQLSGLRSGSLCYHPYAPVSQTAIKRKHSASAALADGLQNFLMAKMPTTSPSHQTPPCVRLRSLAASISQFGSRGLLQRTARVLGRQAGDGIPCEKPVLSQHEERRGLECLPLTNTTSDAGDA